LVAVFLAGAFLADAFTGALDTAPAAGALDDFLDDVLLTGAVA